jgi:hypothetical protein
MSGFGALHLREMRLQAICSREWPSPARGFETTIEP